MDIAHQRNAELHSGASPFDTDADRPGWWERFWSVSEVLINHYAGSLEGFVGPGRAEEVQQHLERNIANVKRRVLSRIDAARQRLELRIPPPERPARNGELEESYECPVCEGDALLQGEYGEHIRFIIGGSEDDWWIEEEVEAWTDYFYCEKCGLVIDGEAYIAAAGLPLTFNAERPSEPEFDDIYDYAEYGNE
jgi:hypothetical protein